MSRAIINGSNDPSPTPKTELDSRGCLVLSDIIHSFQTPISEEHAWALCYQSAKCGQEVIGSSSLRERCCLLTDANQLLIHRDGTLHQDSFTDLKDTGGGPRIKCADEAKIISNLVLVIFLALDYGFSGDDERSISPDLESLLDSMANADGNNAERSETDDEGIERDSGDSDDDRVTSIRNFDFNSILQVCARRLSHDGSITAADAHYKAVCRAYVAEALEFSTFLEKVSKGKVSPDTENFLSKGSKRDAELDKLEFTDWARLWVQVIRDLRQGVKLKKVEFCRGPPIEYELTPYEILMDDIRSRRYKLNKVMVDGSLPKRIKKDAHAIILEFIRSRPPLRKAEDRVLGPAPKLNQTPIERLLVSIRQEHKLAPIDLKGPQKEAVRHPRTVHSSSRRMKSTEIKQREMNGTNMNNGKSPSTQSLRNVMMTTQQSLSTKGSSVSPSTKALPQRRLINFDLNFLSDPDSKDEDDDFDFSDPEDSPSEPMSGFYGHICPEGSQSTPCTPVKKPAEPNTKLGSGEVDKRRRHSVGNPTVRGEHAATLITFPFEYTTTEDVFRTLKCPRASPLLARRIAKLPRSVSKSSLQEEFFQSNHWQTAIECLSLNLEEVVHIRHVLTKAELESLPLDCSLKEDVEKGKICFLCLKTRFSFIFGPRGSSCRLCKRTICHKCCSKMRIPAEQFANVPVTSLSPNISPRDEERDLPGSTKSLTPSTSSTVLPPSNNSTLQRRSVEVERITPDSPNVSRKSGGTDSDSGKRSLSPTLLEDDEARDIFGLEQGNIGGQGPRSLPSVHSISMGIMAMKRRSFGRKTEDRNGQQGGPVVVCHDCKAMVLQIIRSSRTKKATSLMKDNLTLDIPMVH